MARYIDAPNILRSAGLRVRTLAGWETRGHTTFHPRGIIWHHTVTPDSWSDIKTARLLRDGHRTLPGPLSQFGLARDGTWWMIAAGRANHAGQGSWRGLRGNTSVFGIEAFNAGYPKGHPKHEPWPTAQVGSWVLGTAALCAAYGISPMAVCSHREWAYDARRRLSRKTDPHTISMPGVRERIAATLTTAPGERMKPKLVQLKGESTVWVVDPYAVARSPLTSAGVAKALYGKDWRNQIEQWAQADLSRVPVRR